MTETYFHSLLVLISQDGDGTLTKQIPLNDRLEMLAILLSKIRNSFTPVSYGDLRKHT